MCLCLVYNIIQKTLLKSNPTQSLNKNIHQQSYNCKLQQTMIFHFITNAYNIYQLFTVTMHSNRLGTSASNPASNNPPQTSSAQRNQPTAAAPLSQSQFPPLPGGAGASPAQNNNAPLERTMHFSQPQAIVWQVKFIMNSITSKKALNQASNELEQLSARFGRDFDRYLLRELIDQIDLKDPVKAQKDKNEPLKIQLLTQELARCSLKPEFTQYFGDIALTTFPPERFPDFLPELSKRLKLPLPSQILVALSLAESCREENQSDAVKVLKSKLMDYLHAGKPEGMPEYAVHRIMYLASTHPDMMHDENREHIQQYLADSSSALASKPGSHISLRGAIQQDLMYANTSLDEPSICLFKDGSGLDFLDKSHRMLEPWQLLLDLGHFSSYNYPYLLKALEDFKDTVTERSMAKTLINLSLHHTGTDDLTARILQNTFEANKKGDSTLLRKKDLADKKNQIMWSVDNLVRAFRELFSHLNWQKVFEALGEIKDDIALDQKAFATFLQLTNKSKPQNLPYPLTLILSTQWASPLLQLSFIENSISAYIEKKEKSIAFAKANERGRQELLEELSKEKAAVSTEFLHVWLSVDLVERLLTLSDSHYYARVRQLFEAPLKQAPEYLLLTLSLCRVATQGATLLLNELLSLLLPQFLGNHLNSIPVLQALWRNNQSLMIRGICELCRHDQRIMNLSRVLDITQEVKESLMPIVDCEDYYFAVNLAILAGKRDFLHYDVWLQRRISEVGSPFIKALLKYVKEHIITPISDFIPKKGGDQELEMHKSQVLERSHLSKEKLAMTIENLQSLQNGQNPLIKQETREQIREVIQKLSDFFPHQFLPAQTNDEIDNAANDYFKTVFEAEPQHVDSKISDLIETMKRFRNSEIKKEQEIYACMLHSLFDEYRFLHKYPNPYLEKIAKLFGAVIKNRIMDGALQAIALKFMVEAFRREGKRMKFGIIVVRHIIDMLPQFPQYFDSIYEHRSCIQSLDAPLIREIEDLYERTMPKSPRTRMQSSAASDSGSSTSLFDLSEQASSSNAGNATNSMVHRYSNQLGFALSDGSEDRREDVAPAKQQVPPANQKVGATAAPGTGNKMPKIDGNEFLNTFQQNVATAAPAKKDAPAQQKKAQQPPEIPVKAPTTTAAGISPNVGAPAFNPTYKVKGQTAPDLPAPAIETPPTNTVGLNPSSQPFSMRPVVTNPLGVSQSAPVTTIPAPVYQPIPPPAQQPPIGIPANPTFVASRPFRPQAMRSPPPTTGSSLGIPNAQGQLFAPVLQQQQQQPQQQQPSFNQQNYQLQIVIEQKLQKAIDENAKVKLEDIIEDSQMAGPTQAFQEEFKLICNTTGKQNFALKLDQLKNIINKDPSVNLNWFIHFILTKKLTSMNLIQLYIDMIKQCGQKDSVTLTIAQAVEIFKKCLLIDEDQLNRVVHRAQSNASLIKQFLANLGQFIGTLTVASNRPLYAKELDLKQVLCEANLIEASRTKYVLTFVCKILKECSKSAIFKFQNPWVRANLEVLKEIYERASSSVQINGPQAAHFHDITMEIDSLFKVFSINNLNEIQHTGFLHSFLTKSANSPAQQMELMHMLAKPKIIPTIQVLQSVMQNEYPNRGISPSPMGGGFPVDAFGQPPHRMQTPLGGLPGQGMIQAQQIMNQLPGMGVPPTPIDSYALSQSLGGILEKVVISMDFINTLKFTSTQLQNHQDQLLRKIVADAVEQSIQEILPPVVDRSVTIALITTRELVLKDFAFDANPDKILKAADLIVQNLAGSLALVTCREPLKMQFTTNLKKQLQYQLNPQSFNDGEIQLPQLSDSLLNDLANHASKDNLELGCKLIKVAVIQKAVTKVREDILIGRAIEQRQAAASPDEFKKRAVSDEAMMAQFVDLPSQLKPNSEGLTDAQFQVYEDFERLGHQGQGPAGPSGFGGPLATDYQGVRGNLVAQGSFGVGADHAIDVSDDIETYLRQYEQLPHLTKTFEQHLVAKINHMNMADQQDQIKKLIKFCENVFKSACERLAAASPSSNIDKIHKILNLLQVVLGVGLKGEDLQAKLTSNFLGFDGSAPNNASLTLDLMRREILSPREWDAQIAIVIRESNQFGGSAPVEANFFHMLREFFDKATNTNSAQYMHGPQNKEFQYSQFPNVMSVIHKLAENNSDIANFFDGLLKDYRHKTVWTRKAMTDYFNEWATISFDEAGNQQRQEQEVNRFFNNLRQHGLYKDAKAIQRFCKTMLELSIERALIAPDGTRRPGDRLVYRYIESFLNFIAVSLMQFSSNATTAAGATEGSINKQDLLMQVFEALFQVLNEDHKKTRADFNQKPYYRVLINLLRLASQRGIFTAKTHIQVLLSLADLFIKLSPKDFPAFSFAWLELISHKLFMPLFLGTAQQVQLPGQQLPGNQGINQQRRPGQAGSDQATGQQVPQQHLQAADSLFAIKWTKFKDIMMHLFSFLKANIVPGQPMGIALTQFYEASLRVVVVIKNDFPEFLSDFHFNFVNSLPEHCIQLRNIILSAQPRNIPMIDPFSKNLKVDTLHEISLPPRSHSLYENYLQFMNLREDLEEYFRTREKPILKIIADKLMQAEEYVNGRKSINSFIFSAVALFIQNFAQQHKQRQASHKECYEMLKQIITLLSSETRLCLLNSIVNELRYINSHTYFYSWMIIYMFNDSDESVQEQISRILIERLQTHDPHPWGLCITFRELLQNPKYTFSAKSFVQRNLQEIENLMASKLQSFYTYWLGNQKSVLEAQQQQQQQHSSGDKN